MGMMKKDFIALADIFKKYQPVYKATVGDSEYLQGYEEGIADEWTHLKMGIANFCAMQNPKFNRQLWIDYIGGKVGPNGGKIE